MLIKRYRARITFVEFLQTDLQVFCSVQISRHSSRMRCIISSSNHRNLKVNHEKFSPDFLSKLRKLGKSVIFRPQHYNTYLTLNQPRSSKIKISINQSNILVYFRTILTLHSVVNNDILCH